MSFWYLASNSEMGSRLDVLFGKTAPAVFTSTHVIAASLGMVCIHLVNNVATILSFILMLCWQRSGLSIFDVGCVLG